MGNEKVDLVTVVKPPNKKTLLERYDIPIEHLSYEYITKSTEVKELERIVLILRSGEEGVYPDLTKHAEERLTALKPESTVLRVAEPVVTRDMLPIERRKKLESDMNDWMNEMRLREKDLQEGRTVQFKEPVPQPDIRKITFNEQKKKVSQNQNKSKRIGSCDYNAWDKYDADTELNRIDLQHEQKKAEIKRTQQKLREKEERLKKASREAIINKVTLTGTEFNVMAEEERKKGNEAFKAGDYEEALQFYDLSIAIDATTQAFNNRAITYIKLRRYSDALNDCNRVISAEHMNVKALLRRGLALEHLEKKSQALADYEAVLKLEPTNKVAIDAINKLRAPCGSKKIKMIIEEESSPKEIDAAKTTKADEIGQEKSKLTVSSTKASSVTSLKPATLSGGNFTSSQKITHSMQPRVCFCPNAPSSSQHISPLPHMRDIYCSKVTEKSTKLPKFQSIFTSTKMSTEKSSGVIIEEIPNDVIEAPTKVSGKRSTEKTDDKSKKQRGKNATTTTIGAGDSQNGHAKKSGKLLEEFPKKKINQKEDIANGYNFDKISTPYEFLKLWHSLRKDSDLVLRAKLLQCLTPENIATVIGNKLDGDMLCTILRCFEKHFCVPEQSKVLQRFLQSLTQVKRFSMICMFIDKKDKEVLRKVFLFLEAQGLASEDIQDLRKAYGVSM